MFVPTTPHTATTDTNLAEALVAVTTEIGRNDGKASLLLAFNGAVFAGLAALAGHQLPTPATVLGILAATALDTTTVLLLMVVRPCLSGSGSGSGSDSDSDSDRASFPHWARLTETEIRARVTGDTRAASVRDLSVIALGKFRPLRRAVDCTLAFLALAAVAVVLAA
ncbi:Pycsar system effector family protein [Streptomyces sp. NPDC056309]|uniref:Pycsar system effector family protein n=1 Tax=unclassified Streptomyces TaxID=2593676 RepID=UPI0035E0C376